MAIKRVTYDTLKFLVAEIKERYAEKGDIGALGGLDKVAVENLTEDLKSLINGKADAATTLAGYGIKDGMTATEVAAAISTAIAGTDHLSRVMVDSTGDIDTVADDAEKKIYMVKNASGEAGNLYSEYMVINGKLEKVGDWKVDLSSYAKTTEVTAAIANALKTYAKTADVTKAINDIKAGKIEYRLDKTNIIHVPLGKASFTEEQLADNFQTLIDAIMKAKPAAVKGQYLKSVTLTSTMGPGVKINPAKLV